jgi:hypothetical protein
LQNLLELEAAFEDEEFLRHLRQLGRRVAPTLKNLAQRAGRVAGKAQKWARILGLVLHPIDQPTLPTPRYDPGSEDRRPPISGSPPEK